VGNKSEGGFKRTATDYCRITQLPMLEKAKSRGIEDPLRVPRVGGLKDGMLKHRGKLGGERKGRAAASSDLNFKTETRLQKGES